MRQAWMALLGVSAGLLSTLPAAAESWVDGHVYEQRGDQKIPLPQVAVLARSAEGRRLLGRVQTDSEGAYRLAGLPLSRMTIEARRSGLETVRAGGKRGRSLMLDCGGGGQCATVSFELSRGATVSGSVIDQFGEPLEDVFIRLYNSDWQESDGFNDSSYGRSSDDRGVFRIPGVRPGQYVLYPGFDPHNTEPHGLFYQRSFSNVEVEEGSETRLPPIRMRLARKFRVLGRVTGVQLAGARTTVEFIFLPGRGSPFSFSIPRIADVREDGRFAAWSIPPGDYAVALSFFSSSGWQQRRRVALGDLRVEGEMEDVLLEPMLPSTVKGVVELEGVGLVHTIQLGFSSERQLYGRSVTVEPPDYRFELPHALPGSYQVSVQNEDLYIKRIQQGIAVGSALGFQIAAGEHKDLVIQIAGGMGEISGRVKRKRTDSKDDAVTPGAHYRVGLRGPKGTLEVQADQFGFFSFPEVVSGEYQICAWEDAAPGAVQNEPLWSEAGDAVRNFRLDANSQMEIDLTAAP